MQKVEQMGSSDLACVDTLNFKASGEWDVNVRELGGAVAHTRSPPRVRLLSALWGNASLAYHSRPEARLPRTQRRAKMDPAAGALHGQEPYQA